MKSMSKKIIAIDLDGTLLHHDDTISDYTVDIIKKIQELGHLVIISTGRPYRMAYKHYRRLGLSTPMINFNGSLIHIPEKKWEFEHSVTIDKQYLMDILKLEKEFKIDFIASEYRQKFYIASKNITTVMPELFGVEKILPNMLMDQSKITDNPNALLMQTSHSDKYQLAQDIKKHFNYNIEVASWGGPLNILEFSPKGINKAYALSYLLNVLKTSSENLFAFGDEHNDTQMLKFAGIGFAMKNASPLLLPFADEQLDYTNDEDGVAKKLAELFL